MDEVHTHGYGVGYTHLGVVDYGPQAAPPTPPQGPPEGACQLFSFLVTVVTTGLLCIVGFAGNTVSFIVLWQDRSHSALTLLLGAITVADIAVIWMLFVGDVMPGLGYVLPVLADCATVCEYVRAVTEPLLLLAQVCCIWCSLAAALQRHVQLLRPDDAPLICTLPFVRRQLVVMVTVAVLVVAPTAFDHSVTLTEYDEFGDVTTERLADNRWYRAVYVGAVLTVVSHVFPLLLLLYVSLRLLLVLSAVKRLRRALATTYKAQHIDMTQVIVTLSLTLCLCYIPHTVLRAVTWAAGGRPAVCGSARFYLSAVSRLCVALNSSLKIVILSLFAQRFYSHLKESFWTRPTLSPDSSLTSIYQCADTSEMTLISDLDPKT